MFVLGGGRGESILLRFPNHKWGVIDCCSSVHGPEKDERNETVALLQREGVKELEFVCLTHPHSDHYRGMSALLRHFNVKRFWAFPNFPALDARALLMLLEKHLPARAEGGFNPEVVRRQWGDFDELRLLRSDIIRRCGEASLEFESIHRDQLLLSLNYTSDTGARIPLTVHGLTPYGNHMVSYYLPLLRWQEREFQDPVPSRPDHNAISGALKLTFGETVIILGADATAPLWDSVLDNRSTPVAAHVVKVSHHGSENAAPARLWPAFAGKERLHAVVTPFTASQLPRATMIEHLKSHADFVLLTAAAVRRDRDDISRDLAEAPEVESVMEETASVVRGHSWQITVDHRGNVVRTVSTGSQARSYPGTRER